jgi:hypothetical protein
MGSEAGSSNLEIYKMCRDEGKHEFEVLAGRLNTFIMSQAFLLSAFAVSMNNTGMPWSHVYRLTFPVLLSLMGLILSLRALPGISSAAAMIRHWHRRQDKILLDDPELRAYYDLEPHQQTKMHAHDVWFAQTSPYVFGIAWILFGGLALILGILK